MSNKVLLIIDMLNDFLLEGAPLEVPEGRKIISNLSRLLEYARHHKWAVIYLADNHKSTDPEFQIWPPHCVKGTKGAEIIDELKPEDDEIIIPKRRYSGFYGTDLDLWLRELGIDTIILTGILTNICVMYTSADAAQRGYHVIVIKDGVAALSSEDNKWALKQMETIHNAKILTTEDIEEGLK
ncbi:MAG: cysteine hydrolase family protein [Candidatus Helarchaeota archaeon]